MADEDDKRKGEIPTAPDAPPKLGRRDLLMGLSTVPALGLFGYHRWYHYHRRADIGYDLARELWGQGLATEALTAAIRFGFSDMQLNRIEAQTIADNEPSTRLLGRLGFAREGTRRRYSWEEDGTFHDGAIYGLLRDR